MKFNEEKVLRYLKKHLKPSRLKHTLSTKKYAAILAKHYSIDEKKAYAAAILHDCAKWMDDKKVIKCAMQYGFVPDEMFIQYPQLMHGAAGAYIAKEKFGIKDCEILEAICCHTIPKPDMCDLAKLIYVADKIEETRDYEYVKNIRDSLHLSLDEIFLMTLKKIKLWHIENNIPLHIHSVDTYNKMISKLND